jgi:uncharacterized membrane protein
MSQFQRKLSAGFDFLNVLVFSNDRICPMAVVGVLFVSWVTFRGMGALGVAVFSSWQASARYALAIMFLFTGSFHFDSMKHDLARMVPDIFPQPLSVVYATGVLEILGGAGLLFPQFHRAAAFCLIALLVAMFPANVKGALEQITVRGHKAIALWLRTPMQILFIGLLWWSAR